jgi:hypothetical protein
MASDHALGFKIEAIRSRLKPSTAPLFRLARTRMGEADEGAARLCAFAGMIDIF